MLSRPPTLDQFLALPVADDLPVSDFFAGAGGSSSGMKKIPGLNLVSAANHWPTAIKIHNANHPDTEHLCVDLHQENPAYFPKAVVGWFSPECTKWSQSNSTPLPDIEEGLFADPNANDAAQQSRLLMFDVLRYAEYHRYRVMVVENVVDIATQVKYRLAWTEWRKRLTALGYKFRVVSLNAMHAQTYGKPAPQSRDRIYIVCWLAGHPAPDVDKILRPKAYCPRCELVIESTQAWKNQKTIGRYRQTYVYIHGACGTQVEPSWLPAADAIDWSIPGERIGERLKPKTRARIAAGIARYWGPFHLEATGNQYDAADPKHPQHGDPSAYHRVWDVAEPLRTLHTRESKALCVPVEGRDGKDARPVILPGRTQTTRLETGLVTPFVAELRGGSCDARSTVEPLGTVTAGGNHHALVTSAGGTWNDDARPVDDPLRTLTTRDANALVTPYYGNADSALPIDEPIGTLTTVDRYALVHRMNTGGAEMTTPVDEPIRTLTTTSPQALLRRPKVTAEDLATAMDMVAECLFRMFQPHEVAAGMAFAPDYIWQPDPVKKVSNRDLVRAAGNAVCPPCARDIMAVVVESFGAAA
jgi:DNA (cytosine-5)-methyltransferase 1